jgi:hypothetical protein
MVSTGFLVKKRRVMMRVILVILGVMFLMSMCGCTTIPDCKTVVSEFYKSAETTDKLIPPIAVGKHGYAFAKVHNDGTLSLLCVGIGDIPCVEPGDMESVCKVENETYRYGSGKLTLDNIKNGPSI